MFKLVLLFSPPKRCTLAFLGNITNMEPLVPRGGPWLNLIWSSSPMCLDPQLISRLAVVLVFALTETWLLCLFAHSNRLRGVLKDGPKSLTFMLHIFALVYPGSSRMSAGGPYRLSSLRSFQNLKTLFYLVCLENNIWDTLLSTPKDIIKPA